MMKNELSNIQNTYPAMADTVENYYKTSNGKILFSGKYPELNNIKFNIISVDNLTVGNLTAMDSVYINFIIQFNDNGVYDQWTSTAYKTELQDSINANNPYNNKETAAIVATINYNEISNYWKVSSFDIAEEYAKVKVTKSIATKEDILKHINWLVNTNTDELRDPKDMGEYIILENDTIYSDASLLPINTNILK